MQFKLFLTCFFSLGFCCNAMVHGQTIWPGNGHCYEVVLTKGITWADAQTDAVARGGHLATLTTPEENDFVFGLIDFPEFWMPFENLNVGPWIGLSQVTPQSNPADGWEWVNNEGELGYENWHAGEPNDFGGSEECLACFFDNDGTDPPMRKNGWSDVGEKTMTLAYVVEYTTVLGDLNGDLAINLLDVGPFVEAVSDGDFIIEADVNKDGQVNLLDVGPFILLLGGS